MLEIIARLLVALSVAAGGIGTAGGHASPDGNTNAFAAIEAIIAQVSAAVEQAQAAEQPDATGLDRAREVADEHAADGLQTATDATSAGQPNAAAGDAPDVDAPPVDTPPVDVPVATGPPATLPPVPAPPVPIPPVDAPGVGNRP
jgi:hypothetical protein